MLDDNDDSVKITLRSNDLVFFSSVSSVQKYNCFGTSTIHSQEKKKLNDWILYFVSRMALKRARIRGLIEPSKYFNILKCFFFFSFNFGYKTKWSEIKKNTQWIEEIKNNIWTVKKKTTEWNHNNTHRRKKTSHGTQNVHTDYFFFLIRLLFVMNFVGGQFTLSNTSR